jgi:hypothetical protein
MRALARALTASLGPVQEIGASSRVAWIVKGILTAAGVPW